LSIATRRFKRYAIEDFENYIATVKVLRSITNIQIHHTASPTLNGYRLAKDKEGVIRAMWTYHTKTRGFRDIAQHFTVAPDGIWDGRILDWDSGGFLGDQNKGGICIEIIGFYDLGKESFSGDIAENAHRAVAAILMRWPNADIRFHRDQPDAGKTCPGTAILKPQFESDVRKYMKPMSSSEALYWHGVSFDWKGWEVKAKQNKALKLLLDVFADNWFTLDSVPYMGALLSKIAEKLGN